MNEHTNRNRIIIRTSIIGIIANMLLAGFKAIIGTATNSIAIVMDALNNLSDALSSIITIVGTRLAGKAPDRDHPLGHGRYEDLTAMVISVIVLYAGITALQESIKNILHPEKPSYTTISLVIIGAAIVVKMLLGRYVKSVGIKVNSNSLVASGSDALFDSIISISTLVAAGIYIVAGVSLEAYLGAFIAAFIIKAGIDMLRETISKILGERADSSLTNEIKNAITEIEGIYGAYDLLLHNYGPNTVIGEVHIEVPDTYTASMIDNLTREIQEKIYKRYGIAIATVGVYSMNTNDDKALEVKSDITRLVMSEEFVLQMHGFYLDEEKALMIFDIIVDFKAPDRTLVRDNIIKKIKDRYPDYEVRITLDLDISD
ncbi:cation diffusion facilitator family transporter [Mogibacterium pumilum]|uniref:Cation diffusion facilitator family transporter n=1 Tax=Mogibacterium pumilum TaxID=86332 RepID=A0A223AU70_9FIRM|nr:cation diffusion facilitator family transporter [Mogibacterium pumilum]ASS38435.1 cation diffusion facilitator family transporter [Mogibacterium pumilum]